MQAQKSFAWQSFLVILVVIALLLAAIYFLAPGAFATKSVEQLTQLAERTGGEFAIDREVHLNGIYWGEGGNLG